MTARSSLPPAAAVGAAATAIAVLFAGAVIWFTRILPAINDRPVQVSTTTPAAPVPASEAARWSGVAALTGPARCTGVLLDTGAEAAPAYLLTAGHCGPAGDLDANAVVTNQPSTATATFSVITGVEPVEVPVDRVMYSSMKGTDVSVLRLDATLGELRERGLRAYPFVPVGAPSGAPVSNVAVPVAGLDPADVVLRQGSCVLGPGADLVEGGWHFDQMISTNCPGVVGGSSGSPLFDGTDRVAGMITTTTAGALPGGECALDTPCERVPSGVRVVPDTSYAVPAGAVARCFTNGTFGLSDDCPLPRPGLTLRSTRTTFTSTTLAAQGGTAELAVIAGRSTPVDVGVAPLTDRRSCTDPAVYTGAATATPAGGSARVLVPTAPGFYLACVATADGRAEAAQTIFQVDDTPPVRTPTLSVVRLGDQVQVAPVESAPELVSFALEVGPADRTDCAADTGYQPYRGIPVEVTALPATVCVIGADAAGNRGTATSIPVTS